MNTLATLLMGMAGPMALRVLTVIGIGTLTFTGVTEGLQALISAAQTNWDSMGSDLLGLASIAGIPQGMGIIAGAMSGRVGLWVAVSATRFVVGG